VVGHRKMTDAKRVELQHPSGAEQLWCEEPPVLEGAGFLPVTEIRLRTTCTDGAGREWFSENGYLVSAQTTFSTAQTAAVGDGYYGIAPEGPIYSLECRSGKGHDFVLPEDGRLRFTFELLEGSGTPWSEECVRETMREPVENRPATVVLIHNGTPGAVHGANLLRSQGYHVVVQPVLPEDTELDPILKALEGALEESTGEVHLVASGRASEAALELAQRVAGLKSVVIFSGSGLRFSPWRLGGETLPHVVCDHSSLQPRGGSILVTRRIYAEAVADRENRDKGRIEVEKIECPLYLFSGSEDQVWPSSAFSELVAQRRKAHGLEESTEHETFPGVGYDLGVELGLPGLPTTERTLSHNSTGFRVALGGKMGRQSRARRECWEKLLQVLQG